VIIRTAIAPRFKGGDFAGGINAGVDAVLSVLTGDADEWQRRAKVRADDHGGLDWFTIIFMVVILIVIVRAFFRSGGGSRRAHRRRGGGWVIMPVPSGGGWGGGFSGGSGGFGGGFSGGGGSSAAAARPGHGDAMLSQAERLQVEAAVWEAERGTAGEIVVVVARQAERVPGHSRSCTRSWERCSRRGRSSS
jgi:hypothetical protein